jgi:hypothetical protein
MTAVLDPSPIEVRNTDGELVVPQRVTFEIDSARRAFESLKHLALAESEDDLLASAEHDASGVLTRVLLEWKKSGNEVHPTWDNTILGHIEIAEGLLTAEVNSTERAQAFRKIVKKTMGKYARYRDTESITQVQTTDIEDQARDEEHPRLAELPEVQQALNNMLTAHYESWVTQKLPAIGDRTPLEAVQDPDGREMVEALIAQMERDGQRIHPPMDEAIPRRLRERLGLEIAS